MKQLEAFLNTKSLHYDKIDYTAMPKIWESVKHYFSLPKIIHIIGTNGKGSTGRFLAEYLYRSGFSCGHFSSPHIKRFNERFWKNANEATDTLLEEAHKKLISILPKAFRESISYFEYSALLAAVLFEDCDYAIFEAGLGGEYDATNVFKKELSLVTAIGYDHEEYLGDSLKDIALTKLNSIEKYAILGEQKNKEVQEIAYLLAKKKGLKIFGYKEFLNEQEIKSIENFISDEGFAHFFVQNLSLAMSSVKFLGFDIKVELLKGVEIFGRCQKIAPNITIDVGHNPLAALAIKKNFSDKSVTLIYNSYKDKKFKKILSILKPIIKEVEVLPLDNKRALKYEQLSEVLNELSLKHSKFSDVKKSKEYLVFGSFSVVEEFLKRYKADSAK